MTERPRGHREGVPAFAGVYDGIRALAARTGLQPGDRLPGEDALAQAVGAPRALVKEALLLLHEDGHLTRDGQRLWVLAEPTPAGGVGFTDSFHRLLGPGVRASHRLHVSVEEMSSFTGDLLGGGVPTLVWETVLVRGDQALAATLEFMRLDAVPAGLADETDPTRHDVDVHPTLLEALGPERRAGLVPRLWRVAPVSRRTERLAWMDIAPHAVPAVVTVLLTEDGAPVYLAKNLFDLDSFTLTVDLRGDAS